MRNNETGRNVLGIVGGLGPRASTEFLKTIYEYSQVECEQSAPIVVMYSDPTFPDRTETFLQGGDNLLLQRLLEALDRLGQLQVSKIVICCVTLHHLLPRLPPDLRKQIVSLIDVIFAHVLQQQRKHLLMCTSGTRQLGIFQRHEQWGEAQGYLVLPEPEDQETIHRVIYQIKQNCPIEELLPRLESLLTKYQVDSFIAGCTEIHLLAKHLTLHNLQPRYQCLDPLSIIAREVALECVTDERPPETTAVPA